MPLLEFGSLVEDILKTTETQLKEQVVSLHDSFRNGLLKGIVVEVQRLYIDQLQALRNYYGQRYEAILDDSDDDNDNNSDDENNRDELLSDEDLLERKWAISAEHLTTAFQAAAKNAAIPLKYRSMMIVGKGNGNDHNNNDVVEIYHINALKGLIQDMMEATERRKNDQSIASMMLMEEEEDSNDDINDEEGTGSSTRRIRKRLRRFRQRRVPKWLERITARAFVFGVNYVQGWLAWQGIKKAALERDRNQPKFPLF